MDESLALVVMSIHQHQKMFTEGEVFRDYLVHCLPKAEKETESQKVRGLPEAAQMDVGKLGGEPGVSLTPCQCPAQTTAQSQHSYMPSDFLHSGSMEQPLNYHCGLGD